MRQNLKQRILSVLRKRERAKKLYRQAQEELDSLVAAKAFKPVKLSRRYTATVVDLFAEKSTAWRSTPMHRYDIEVKDE